MANLILDKCLTAETQIPAYRIVKAGSTEGAAALATAATAALIGVNEAIQAEIGEPVDVMKIGIADVQAGATIAAGDPITANATGQGIKGVTGNRIIGFAESSAVSGDIFPVLLAPGFAA